MQIKEHQDLILVVLLFSYKKMLIHKYKNIQNYEKKVFYFGPDDKSVKLFISMLKKFDIFPKYTDPDVKVKTNSGALLSVITITIMVILFCHETLRFLQPRIYEDVSVDTSRVSLQRTMTVNFNLSVYVPCGKLHISAYDVEGNLVSMERNEIRMHRVDENGISIDSNTWLMNKREDSKKMKKKKQPEEKFCGKCYGAGAKGQCCNSCEDVINAFKAKGWGIEGIDGWQQCIDEGYANLGKESCNLVGELKIPRISGYLYFALEDYKPNEKRQRDISRLSNAYNLTHTIEYLYFGAQINDEKGPLDGLTVVQDAPGLMVYNYDLQVVPTKWFSRRNFQVNTFKFHPMITKKNLTEKLNKGVPGIFLNYNIAPVTLVQYETAYTFWKYITSVCAIVGGAFTCASLIDQFFFRTLSTIEGKRSIGKAE